MGDHCNFVADLLRITNLAVHFICSQQQWTLTDFVVSKITRTCVAECTATSSPALDSVTASDTSIVACTDPPSNAPDLTGLSALQCHQCSGTSSDAACKGVQTGSSPKTGGITLAAAAACTQCYVSGLWLR